MARIAYARVSGASQSNDPQLDRLGAAGVDRVFTDVISGKLASRPEWDKCLEFLRSGDVLVIVRLDRIGRSVKNLIEVVNSLGERGIDLLVLDQAIDTTTPAGKFMFHILASLAEFERDLIRERTMDGLAAARARGRTGGRKSKLGDSQQATLRKMYEAKGGDGIRQYTVQEIAEALGVHRSTVYDYLAKDADVAVAKNGDRRTRTPQTSGLSKKELAEEAAHLIRLGVSPEQAATQLKVTTARLEAVLREAKTEGVQRKEGIRQ